MMRALIMILGLGLAASAAAQTVYKWTDENGVVHYGSRPPENSQQVDSIRLRSAPPPPAATTANTATAETRDDMAGDAAALDTPPAEQVSVDPAVQSAFEFDQQISAQVKQENCRRAQHNLAVLTVTPRVGQRNEDGSMEYTRLDDDDRANRISQAQQQIDQYCSG